MVRATAETPGLRPVPRPQAGRAAAAAAPAADFLGPLVLFAFMMSLAVPGTFGAGPVNLTVYRLVLIAACIPLGLRWISGRAGPVTAVDLLFLASCVWISIALVMVHGLSRIAFIGTNFIELFGAYLVGRVLVRDAAGHRRFLRAMLLLVVLLFPFALLEFLTGTKLLNMVFGTVMSMKETGLPQQRLGFTRAATSFSHPIHFGLFASLVFANVYVLFWRSRTLWRLGATGFVAFAAMLSISSSALFSMVLQTAMIVWDRALAFLKSRWVIGIAGGVGLLAFLLVSVQGGLFTYINENLIFAQGAGEHRLDVYHYGMLEVLRHPFFGVGLNDWARPFWRPHPTLDSFWLMTAVRHGIPGILLLMIGLVTGMLRISAARGLDEDGCRYRSGYLIALCGLILTLSTVHIWGPVTVLVMAYLGAGAWFYNGDHRAARADPARLRRERAVARRAGAVEGAASTATARESEAIVRPQPVGYEKEPGRRHGSATVAGGTAGRGGRGAGGTAAGPRPRKRV
jgi:hypothetical protein